MECKVFEEKLSDYLEGELEEEDVRNMEVHLACCTSCSDKLKGVKSVREALRELRRIRPSALFEFALRSRIHWEIVNPRNLKTRLKEKALSIKSLPLLAAFCSVVVLCAFLLVPDESGDFSNSIGSEKLGPSFFESGGITNYVLETILPLELGSGLHQSRADSALSGPRAEYVTF